MPAALPEYGPQLAIPCLRVQPGRQQEWVFLLFIFFSIPNVFHDIFQLTCCSVRCAGCPPSVDRENMGSSLPSPVCELNGEGGKCEYSSCFYFFSYHSQCFSWQFSINLLFSQHPPSVDRGNKGPLLPPPTCKLNREGSNGECPSFS